MARKTESGYSLVEVLIALGLMTGVMVAVCSMFVLGGTYVKAGKQLTQATALAQNIMEDLNKHSYTGAYLFLQGASPDPNATSASSDTRVTSSVADGAWGPDIRTKLFGGYAVVNMTPIGGTASPARFSTGEGVRVTVTLGWKELRRNRTVKVENVRW